MQGRVSIDSFRPASCSGKGACGNSTTRAIRGLAELTTRRVVSNHRGLCAVASLSFAADQGFGRGTIRGSDRISSCLARHGFGHWCLHVVVVRWVVVSEWFRKAEGKPPRVARGRILLFGPNKGRGCLNTVKIKSNTPYSLDTFYFMVEGIHSSLDAGVSFTRSHSQEVNPGGGRVGG